MWKGQRKLISCWFFYIWLLSCPFSVLSVLFLSAFNATSHCISAFLVWIMMGVMKNLDRDTVGEGGWGSWWGCWLLNWLKSCPRGSSTIFFSKHEFKGFAWRGHFKNLDFYSSQCTIYCTYLKDRYTYRYTYRYMLDDVIILLRHVHKIT